MRLRILPGVASAFLVMSMIGFSAVSAFALGELPVPTPTPNLSTPTPIPTAIPTALLTPTPDLSTPIPIPTPTPDTIPPVISNVTSQGLLYDEATITWTTNELTTSRVTYDEAYHGHSSELFINTSGLLVHTAAIVGLSASTTYHYCIHATDLAGNVTTSCDHSFTTSAPPVHADTTAPIVSNILPVSLLTTTATITWTTNELSFSHLEYGTTTGYGFQVEIAATALLAHTALLTGLTANTTYHYCIHATDLSDNTGNLCGHTFTTAAASTPIDTNPPTISDISISFLTTTSTTIHWTTEEIANGEIEYGTTPSYGTTTPVESPLSVNHSILLSGLTPNTLYHYRIKSSDQVGNLATSPDNTFTTEAVMIITPTPIPTVLPTLTPTPTPSPTVTATSTPMGTPTPTATATPIPTPSLATAVISGVETAEVTFNTATITWQTDIPSDSQVEYGDNALFGNETALDATLTTAHSVTLSNLSPNTDYYYRVISKPFGLVSATVSSPYDLNTLSEPIPQAVAAQILSVSVGAITTTSATISTVTDTNTTAQIEYGITTGYGQTSVIDTLALSHMIALADLEPSTTYHYRMKAIDMDGDITLSEDHTFMTATPPVPVPPPAAVTNLSVAGNNDTSVTLEWDVVAGSDAAAEYDIRYSTSPITSGNFSSATQAENLPIEYEDVALNATSRLYIVAGLSPATQYYFALKSKYEHTDSSPISNIVSVTLASASPVNQTIPVSSGESSGGAVSAGGGASVGSNGSVAGPISEPSMLNASGDDTQIVLSWQNPAEYNYVRTVVVEKTGDYPTSPTDGQVVYEGKGETFTETNLTNGVNHYYTVYAYDHAKNYSSGVQVSLAPSQGVTQEILYQNPEAVAVTSTDHFVEVLKRGSKDIEIEHLQEILSRDEGLYPEKLITGYFGTLTEQALKRFQEKYNLPQTGVTDSATQVKLNEVSRTSVKLQVPQDVALFDHDLSRGNQGDDVAALQKFLIYEGSYTSAIADGTYGPLTVQAVKTFQKKYGIKPVSGYFGVKTRHKVRDITGL